jgi:hypothetical protein
VLIAREPPCSRFQRDSFACPTELSRETSRASQPKMWLQSANKTPEIYKADVPGRSPSYRVSYIGTGTPPNLRLPLHKKLVCERKLHCPFSSVAGSTPRVRSEAAFQLLDRGKRPFVKT